jgi:endonuclease YncB( thermonuclease family)
MRIFFVVLSVLIALCHQSNASASTILGTVIAVSDGDTITVLDKSRSSHKIRLTGIDAPEKSQAFGQASKQTLSNLIYLQTVKVEWEKKDRYGRVLGKVIHQGRDINLEQVQRGMAWHYKDYIRDQSIEDRNLYAEAELKAREQKTGLWKDLDPVKPSEYRRKK